MIMKHRHTQYGATLFMSLIMLLVLTLFAVSAITTSTVNLRIVGNTQFQQEAKAAAQQVIEQFVSLRSNFEITPGTAYTPAAVNIDVNNDGTDDYIVSIQRSHCLDSRPLAPSGYTIIPDQNTWWDLQTSITDTDATDAVIVVHQGVRVPLPASVDCG
jgi:Tfp pilus assembly protein PilX